ncbi:probable disease resistance protein At4g27220 [Ziziphus jujuba]|uniref:Probable disease resistance protein At4g27220 n=1 Tax=Ziziphus jujuba TaxID=326968 RepID=A0ABM3IRS4_ZIZJJ|nr:probable disease resistance protein At4g27220 [Ziziphus jujuba]
METVTKVAEGLINYEGIHEKMNKLKRKCDRLKNREEDVKTELEYAEGLSFKKRRKEVENWLTNVASIKNEVEMMEQQVRESSWLSSHLLQEPKIARLTEEVRELIHQGQFPDGLTLDVDGNQQIELITTPLIGQKFQQHKDEIWEGLRSNNVSKIGIWGMGGVGKTTLLTHVHDELLAHQDFSVVWVTVSQNFSIQKLQNDIAKTRGLNLKNDDDEMKRAAELAQHLKNMNNFVFILDDVWQPFPLHKVGIPAGGNGCKLILTSRSLEVCRRMDCEKKVLVTPLSKNEDWELFTEKLGHGRALSPEIEPIAKSLTEKCCGLPLAIITMAGSMKGVKDIAEWRDALEKLKEPVAERNDDMGTEVFQVLKHSYDQLKDLKAQQCLLYCSLFPEDYIIDREKLIEHFIDEGFVDGLRNRRAGLDRGHTVLNKLENVCLLEAVIKKYDGKRYVKMHDLVRSMAIQTGRAFQFLVEAGEQLREIPGEEKWAEDLKKVSLMKNLLSHIPSSMSPKCSRLTTLMLNHNLDLKAIPDCFFSRMPQLRVLDLSHTGIIKLPTSISELVNLIALWLEDCKELKYVPSLETLKALRRLNLRKTGITEVPDGLDMLLNLIYLNLKQTLIRMIPDGILSKLSCLQYLAIDAELRLRGEEIVELNKFEAFKGNLCDMSSFNTYVRWREENGGASNYALLLKMTELTATDFLNDVCTDNERYVYLSGCQISESNGRDERDVYLSGCKISKGKCGEDSFVLPKDVQRLVMQNCNDTASLCDIPSLHNATKLSMCKIRGCQGMEHVVCSCCSVPLIQYLDSLLLGDLEELRALIGADRCCASASASSNLLQPDMFSSLRQLFIWKCPKIKRLFMRDLLPNLKNLVDLRVGFCENMVEIIGEASDEDEDDENREAVSTTSSIIYSLPKLSYLSLYKLPKLKRFCTSKIVFDSLREIKISQCPTLSFNGDRVQNDGTYRVVNSRIGERIG